MLAALLKTVLATVAVFSLSTMDTHSSTRSAPDAQFNSCVDSTLSRHLSEKPGEDLSAGIRARKQALIDAIARDDVPGTRLGKQVHPHVLARLHGGNVDRAALDALARSTDVTRDLFGLFTLALANTRHRYDWPPVLAEGIRQQALNYKGFMKGGTENHVAMRRGAAMLFGEAMPEAVFFHGLPGEELARIAKEYVRRYGRTLYRYSSAEYLSPVYFAVNTAVWTNLATHAKDPVSRFMADAIADYFFADLAVNHLNGVVLPAKRNNQVLHGRVQKSYPYKPIQWLAWLYFSAGNDILDNRRRIRPGFAPAPAYLREPVLHAINGWLPKVPLLDIGMREVSLPFTVRQSKASFSCLAPSIANAYGVSLEALRDKLEPLACDARHNVRHVFVTDDYLIGHSHAGDFAHDRSEVLSDHFGLTWRTDAEFNTVRISHPHFFWRFPVNETGKPWLDNDWAGSSPFKSSVLRDNVYAVIYDLPSEDPFVNQQLVGPAFSGFRNLSVHPDVYIYLPETLVVQQRLDDGSLVFEDGKFYLLIHVPRPEKSDIHPAEQRGYVRLRLPGPLTAAFLVAGSEAQYGSLAAFVEHANKIQFDFSGLVDDKTIRFNDVQRGAVVSLAAHGSSDYFPRITDRDGIVDRSQWPLWASPYVTQEGGVLNIHNGVEGYEIDWSGRYPEYRFFRWVKGRKGYLRKLSVQSGQVVEEALCGHTADQ